MGFLCFRLCCQVWKLVATLPQIKPPLLTVQNLSNALSAHSHSHGLWPCFQQSPCLLNPEQCLLNVFPHFLFHIPPTLAILLPWCAWYWSLNISMCAAAGSSSYMFGQYPSIVWPYTEAVTQAMIWTPYTEVQAMPIQSTDTDTDNAVDWTDTGTDNGSLTHPYTHCQLCGQWGRNVLYP